MAQATYTSRQAVTLATRKAAYDRICIILEHLDALNLNLLSMVKNADNTVSITLSGPLAADQLDHLDLV